MRIGKDPLSLILQPQYVPCPILRFLPTNQHQESSHLVTIRNPGPGRFPSCLTGERALFDHFHGLVHGALCHYRHRVSGTNLLLHPINLDSINPKPIFVDSKQAGDTIQLVHTHLSRRKMIIWRIAKITRRLHTAIKAQ